MKKLYLLLTSCFITACQHQAYTENCDYNICNSNITKYSTTQVVRKPVEIIYEDTIYTTTYKPVINVKKRRIISPYYK